MLARRYAMQNVVMEFDFASGKAYADPFNEVDLDVVFTGPGESVWHVPAFWAGGPEWRVRFAPPEPGLYRFQTVCSDPGNADLHAQEGRLEAVPYASENPLLKHGPLRVRNDRKGFEHADGTPFFWLGDTWWMALCGRIRWPEEFQELTALRRSQGFTVIQLVAGLFPDMPAFDPRGANEGGFPWEPEFARINPAFFDAADLRIRWLVREGLVPCILGSWGYYLPWLGVEKMKRHWHHLVARYGAYPVLWCLAGETTMPWYLSHRTSQEAADGQSLREEWTDIARYIRRADPFRRPVTAHPCAFSSSSREVGETDLLDFDMVQAGHGDIRTAIASAGHAAAIFAKSPLQPVVMGEVCYEGIMGASREEVQRFAFWTSLLSGLRGFTYGANGLWQLNTEQAPFGPSPHGGTWGDTPWREASRWPGARQVSLGKRLLERYPYWRLEPHPEWVLPVPPAGDFMRPYAADIPGELRLIYFPEPLPPWRPAAVVAGLEPGLPYHAFFFDPATGRQTDLGLARGGPEGLWPVPMPPLMQDMVLVLDRQSQALGSRA